METIDVAQTGEPLGGIAAATLNQIRIVSMHGSGRPNGSPLGLRVLCNGEQLPFVRGFALNAHVRDADQHLGGPAMTLTVFHYSEDDTGVLEAGPATLLVEVPVWVQYVRNVPPAEPERGLSGAEVYATFYNEVKRLAESHPAMRAFVDSLALPDE